MLRRGELRVREVTPDAAVKGRTQQRLTQLYKGVPVFGGDVTRSLEGGRTVGDSGRALHRHRARPCADAHDGLKRPPSSTT